MRPANRPKLKAWAERPLEAGTSLVELMMVMLLLAIVLPTVYGTLSIVQHQARVTVDRFTATGNAQIAMDRVSRELRAATPVTVAGTTTPAVFVSASTVDVWFYASLEAPIPALVHACLAAAGATTCPTSPTMCYSPAAAGSAWPGCSLLDVVTQGSGTVSSPVYTGTPRPVVDAVNVNSAGTIFAYYDVNGAVISPAALATAAGLASIETVKVTITSQASQTGPPVPLTMKVPLPNVDYSRGP